MVFRTLTEDVLIDSGADANLRSYTAEEAVLAGQLVKPGAAANSVEPSDTDGEFAIGFAVEDAAQGEQVTVARDGTKVRATSGTGTVSAGDAVGSHGGSGEEGEVDTASGSDDASVGFAVADDAGTNDDVLVEVNLGAGGEVN